MKKIRLIASALIVVLLLSACALADVVTTGNVNLRSGPGLKYDVVTSVSSGKHLDYLGDSSVDDRGIVWYLVEHNGMSCWISSVYSELVGESIRPREMPDLSRIDEFAEVGGYFWKNLQASAAEVGLDQYAEVASEATYQFRDEYLTFGAAYSAVEFMELKGGEYTIFGVAIGMTAEQAIEHMEENGLSLDSNDSNVIVFEHPVNADSAINCDGFDSCINIWLQDGVVVAMDWSAYTG